MEDVRLNDDELRTFRAVAGLMVPASERYGIPGADDEAIFADIVRSLGRDGPAVRTTLAALDALAGGAFSALGPDRRAAVAERWQKAGGADFAALGRAILQCYYRDDRIVRSLGMETRPPFPKGYAIEDGDWSLLDNVRTRPKLWRDPS